MSIIEGQVSQLKGLVQQQDALNAVLQQRVQTAGEAESRAKVPPDHFAVLQSTMLPARSCKACTCCSVDPA